MRSLLKMVPRPTRVGRGAVVPTIAVVLALSGAGLVSADQLHRSAPPPMPAVTTPPPDTPVAGRSESHRSPSPPPTPTASPRQSAGLPPSAPVWIDIPAIGVEAPLVKVGDASNGAIDVPPANEPHIAGWYARSVTPGEPGRTVIVGHLDSRYSGQAVFYHLGALKPGQAITVTRRDGVAVVYRVDGVALHPRDELPSEQIYGPADRPELRLITCGGTYKEGTGWSSNIVLYAHMSSWGEDTPPGT
jgi:hypothetical protein